MEQNYSFIIILLLPFFSQQQTNAFSTSRASTHIQHSITTHYPPTIIPSISKLHPPHNNLIRYATKQSLTNHTINPNSQPFDDMEELAGFKSDLRQQTDSTIISETTKQLEPPFQNILYKLDTIYKKSKSLSKQIYQRLEKLYKQVFSQDFGNRGEEYLLLQSLLGVAVINGQFPLFQNLISILFGPFLWSVGIFGLSSSTRQLYGNHLYSAFVIPPGVNCTDLNTQDIKGTSMDIPQDVVQNEQDHNEKNITIVMNGMYQHVRHPMYASTVAIMVGYSIWTKSAMRLLYTMVYFQIIQKKVRVEEECLMQLGDYNSYQRKVKDAFFPLESLRRVWKNVKRGRQGSMRSVVAEGLEEDMENHHKVPRTKKSGTVMSKVKESMEIKEPMEIKETFSDVEKKDSDKLETSLELKQEKVVKAKDEEKDIKAKDEKKNSKEKDIQKKDTLSKNGIFSFKNNSKNSKGLFP